VVRLSLEQLKALPFVELKALWKEYVSALAAALVEANGQEACPAGQRAVQLMGELRFVLSCLMSDNPSHAHNLRRAHRLPPPGWQALSCSLCMIYSM
jgi:hypothetical protein